MGRGVQAELYQVHSARPAERVAEITIVLSAGGGNQLPLNRLLLPPRQPAASLWVGKRFAPLLYRRSPFRVESICEGGWSGDDVVHCSLSC